MIRRAANTVSISGTTTTITATGWVLGWYLTSDPVDGQSMMAVFEENAHGYVSEVPLTSVQFQDGQPAIIPEY